MVAVRATVGQIELFSPQYKCTVLALSVDINQRIFVPLFGHVGALLLTNVDIGNVCKEVHTSHSKWSQNLDEV